MTDIYKRYADDVYHSLHFGATWTPGSPLRLGTVGTFQDGVLVALTDLSTIGIPFDEEKGTQPEDKFFTSEKGVSVRFKASGESPDGFKALTQAQAGAKISFSSDYATLFVASRCLESRIKDIPSLEKSIGELAKRGAWQPEWAVVTHLVHAKSATIAISSSRGTTLEISAKGSVGSGAQIGKLGAGVSLAYTDSMSQLFVASAGLTPLFHTLRFKRTLWDRLKGWLGLEGATTGSASPTYGYAAALQLDVKPASRDFNLAGALEQVDVDRTEGAEVESGASQYATAGEG